MSTYASILTGNPSLLIFMEESLGGSQCGTLESLLNQTSLG